jgi:hypothetical protein
MVSSCADHAPARHDAASSGHALDRPSPHARAALPQRRPPINGSSGRGSGYHEAVSFNKAPEPAT